jgi:hypothetical protein
MRYIYISILIFIIYLVLTIKFYKGVLPTFPFNNLEIPKEYIYERCISNTLYPLEAFIIVILLYLLASYLMRNKISLWFHLFFISLVCTVGLALTIIFVPSTSDICILFLKILHHDIGLYDPTFHSYVTYIIYKQMELYIYAGKIPQMVNYFTSESFNLYLTILPEGLHISEQYKLDHIHERVKDCIDSYFTNSENPYMKWIFLIRYLFPFYFWCYNDLYILLDTRFDPDIVIYFLTFLFIISTLSTLYFFIVLIRKQIT